MKSPLSSLVPVDAWAAGDRVRLPARVGRAWHGMVVGLEDAGRTVRVEIQYFTRRRETRRVVHYRPEELTRG